MRPENVNPGNFQVIEVVYDNQEFSIAFGLWENRDRVLAMRWNGDNDSDAGYPKTFGHPMWFIISNELRVPILTSLIGLPFSDKERLLRVIDESVG